MGALCYFNAYMENAVMKAEEFPFLCPNNFFFYKLLTFLFLLKVFINYEWRKWE